MPPRRAAFYAFPRGTRGAVGRPKPRDLFIPPFRFLATGLQMQKSTHLRLIQKKRSRSPS